MSPKSGINDGGDTERPADRLLNNDYTQVSGAANASKGGYVPSTISSKPVNTISTGYKPTALGSKPNLGSKPAGGGGFLARMAA